MSNVYVVAACIKMLLMSESVYLIIKNAYFLKNECITQLHKNGHNFTCDQYFFMKFAPLDSAHVGLSIHAKNSVFMKNCKWSIFPPS